MNMLLHLSLCITVFATESEIEWPASYTGCLLLDCYFYQTHEVIERLSLQDTEVSDQVRQCVPVYEKTALCAEASPIAKNCSCYKENGKVFSVETAFRANGKHGDCLPYGYPAGVGCAIHGSLVLNQTNLLHENKRKYVVVDYGCPTLHPSGIYVARGKPANGKMGFRVEPCKAALYDVSKKKVDKDFECSRAWPYFRSEMGQSEMSESIVMPNLVGNPDLPAGKCYANVQVGSAENPCCFVQVRVQSDLQVVSGFVTAVNDDMPGLDAVGESIANVLTLHADATAATVLKQVEMMHIEEALCRRMNCTFEYYSDPFTCTSEAIVVLVYGEDSHRQQFRRQEITYCIDPNNSATNVMPPLTTANPPVTQKTGTTNVAPVTTPPPPSLTTPTKSPLTTTTGPPPITFDVVILIDVSKSAATTYDDMSQFVLTVMQNFAVSQDYARTAIIPVFGTTAFGPIPPVANLDAISSYNTLASYLSQAKTFSSDFDDQGQALTVALNSAIDPNFKRAGYRTNITNHLILYITATTGFISDPQTTAQQVLKSGDYGIVTVGYGPGVTDQGSMQKIAGGNACSFYAADKTALNQLTTSVQALISSASSNGGKYCGN